MAVDSQRFDVAFTDFHQKLRQLKLDLKTVKNRCPKPTIKQIVNDMQGRLGQLKNTAGQFQLIFRGRRPPNPTLGKNLTIIELAISTDLRDMMKILGEEQNIDADIAMARESIPIKTNDIFLDLQTMANAAVKK